MIRHTGTTAAIISLVSILVWFISFGIIATEGPLFYWSTTEAYFEYIKDYGMFWQNLAKAFMLIFSISFLLLHLSLFEFIEKHKRFQGRIGILFLSMFTLLSAIHYFTQVSAVRFNLEQGTTQGLEHFLQANPSSFLISVNMLGWTLMLGLGSFFLAFMFGSTKRQKWLGRLHLLNAFFCFLALAGFLLQQDLLTFPAINLGVGGCITIISVLAFLEIKKDAAL